MTFYIGNMGSFSTCIKYSMSVTFITCARARVKGTRSGPNAYEWDATEHGLDVLCGV